MKKEYKILKVNKNLEKKLDKVDFKDILVFSNGIVLLNALYIKNKNYCMFVIKVTDEFIHIFGLKRKKYYNFIIPKSYVCRMGDPMIPNRYLILLNDSKLNNLECEEENDN